MGTRSTFSSHWQPCASLAAMKARAEMYAQIRTFFTEHRVLEVETPLLGLHTVTEPAIESLALSSGRFCQTSPEYAMKRLLASGTGPIYQISKVFRAEEQGRRHNPEFTMLEWYRPGFSYHSLMNEVARLFQHIGLKAEVELCSYQQLFEQALSINPLTVTLAELKSVFAERKLDVSDSILEDAQACLDYLMASVIEPALNPNKLSFVTYYPANQAALAKLSPENPQVAHRFECYYKGLELANGFEELTDEQEQRKRFEKDNQTRAQQGLPILALDEWLLAALKAGLPECSGVAVGLDRVLMCLLGVETIQDVLSFPWERA